MIHRVVLVVLLALALPAATAGCVLRADHEALRRQLHDTRAAASRSEQARDARIAMLRVQLRSLEDQAAALRRDLLGEKREQEQAVVKLVAAQRAVAQLTALRDRLQGELAALLRDKSQLRASTDEIRRALAEVSRQKLEADQRIAELRALVDRFRGLIDAGTLRVRIVDGRMVLALDNDVLFPSGRSTLSKVGQRTIVQVTRVLGQMTIRRYQVEGHTDNVPIHSERYPSNWELSQARALRVVRAMIDAGMAPERVSAAAFGEHRPVADNQTAAGRAANRRIEIVLLPDLSGLPGSEELRRLSGQR